MSNQTSSTNSTFKMPMAPPVYPSQSETLLFQDIIEEKTVLLHNILNEFLKVHPYRKFDIEFNTFLKRLKRIILDGQRTGTNVSRIANSSQITPLYSRPSASFNIYRPSTSFNYRPPTTMSMVSSNHHSTLRLPENDCQNIEEPSEHSNPFKPPDVSFQPIEPRKLSNSFKRPDVICIQPKVILSRIDQSLYNSHVLPSTSATVIEVSKHDNVTVEKNNTLEIPQQSTSQSSRNQPTVHNTYSDVTFEENKSSLHLEQNDNQNDDSNSIESLLEGVGFKIIVGTTDNNNETAKKSIACQLKNNQSNEKFLSMWSLNMKLIKSASQKHVIILTGNLLGDDKSTVIEKRHEAGIIEGRKTTNLVKTKNGLYHLVGNIIGGSPNELYQACLEIHGIPRTWRNIVKQLTEVEKKTENVFDFSVNSPLGPTVRQTKSSLKLDESVTRKGTAYTKYMSLNTQQINKKRKLSEYDETENNKNKHPRLFHEKLPPLLSSTPKKPKKQPSVFVTPSQILKNKLKQNVYNNSNNKLSRVNNSININKKRQSHSKEQVNCFLKPKTPEKTLLSDVNTTKSTKQMTGNSTVSSKNSSRESKQTSINNSKKLNSNNSSVAKSKNKTPENSSVTKRSSLNNTNQQSKINSINSTNNNSVNKSKSKSKTNASVTSQKNVKAVKKPSPKIREKRMAPKQKAIDQKKKKIASGTALINNNNTCKKASLPKTKVCDKSMNNTGTVKEKLKQNKTKQLLSPNRGADLFADINYGDYGNVTNSDFNVMESPGKLSMASGTDKSRSVTPPFFSDQWGSSGKSMIISEPPTPLSKSGTAKALKRVKAPKITLEDEIKFNKKKMNKGAVDYKTVKNKIDKMLQFGNVFDEND